MRNGRRKSCKIDTHVHLEKGDYSVEWIEQLIEYAVKRNIDEIYFFNYISAIFERLTRHLNMGAPFVAAILLDRCSGAGSGCVFRIQSLL